MPTRFLKLINSWELIRKPLVLIVSAIILSFFGVYLFSQTRVSGDAASHLLLAISPILKIGSPYKDFWDIKPPVLPLSLYLWNSLFGFGILSIRIFNIIIAALVTAVSYFVYKRVFQTPVFETIFLFTVIIVLSPILNSMMIPTEMLGLLLSMVALLVLISFRKDFPKFYLSGLLFFAASQAKEPFTLTVLAMLPVFFGSLLKKGFSGLFKNLAQFLLGVLTSFVGIYIYLASFAAIGSYLEVFKYKQAFYPFSFERLSQNFLPGIYSVERTFTEFSHGFSILILFAALSFYLVNKFKKTVAFNLRSSQLITKSLIVADSEKIIKYAVFLYALGSFLGFGLGGSFGSHYLIQVVVPFYIITGLVVSYLYNNASFLFNKPKPYFYTVLFVVGFSVIVIMPKRPYLSSYLPRTTSFSMTDDVIGFEKRITELTTKDQCVLSVYGWGVSENYLYSMRRPCTRFFLANIVWEDWQKKEYAKSVIENPPAVIVYQTSGADLDIRKFESEVINLSKIIKNCYTQDVVEKVIYIPKTSNIDGLRNCIKVNSI
jgi:hypothetical protein